MHALLPACMEGILWHDHHMLDRIEEEAELGMNDQDSFLLQEQVRFRRASDWLSCPITPVKLAGIIIPLKIATSILGKLFAGGSRYESGEAKNIMPFVRPPLQILKCFLKFLKMVSLCTALICIYYELLVRCQGWTSF